ncbi:MAG: glycosyltransferase family 39 protein [Proteobacteria bacterium]|nr:glycosyltransferase family 39 protein [Pseudomonadota bacterium]
MTTLLKNSPHSSSTRLFFYFFSIIIAIRLLGAFFLPVIDPSEARYAEIARKLLESGNWITLFHDYGVPFWAKPPLSSWLSAGGMALLGVNGFGARLPILLLSLGLVGLIMNLANTRRQDGLSTISALILLTGVLFYIASAAVMTDMALAFGTTLSMVAFWHALKEDDGLKWKYLFFIGLAIGLLGKGPIALILTGCPLFLWTMIGLRLKEVWQKLPWISGTLLMLALAVPWHILAELETPGFLNYYIIGEHFSRFFVKGWAGDLYGHAHAEPLGFIWVFWLLATLPWSLWLIGIVGARRRDWRTLFASEDGWVLYLLLWALSPLLIFTFSRNIIWTYSLPGIPAFAVLMGHFLLPLIGTSQWLKRTFFASVCITPLVMLSITIYSHFVPEALNNQQRLVQSFMKIHNDSKLIYYCPNCYSAEFYSQGTFPLLRHEDLFRKMLESNEEFFVAMRIRKVDDLPQQMRDKLVKVQQYGKTILFKKASEQNAP